MSERKILKLGRVTGNQIESEEEVSGNQHRNKKMTINDFMRQKWNSEERFFSFDI
jgi:hypothetical protein